jgi:hypothetical protein
VELILAMVLFVALLACWFVLPGTVTAKTSTVIDMADTTLAVNRQ